eukprot:6212144-Pleurochrysis_carterae.AAC.3
MSAAATACLTALLSPETAPSSTQRQRAGRADSDSVDESVGDGVVESEGECEASLGDTAVLPGLALADVASASCQLAQGEHSEAKSELRMLAACRSKALRNCWPQ